MNGAVAPRSRTPARPFRPLCSAGGMSKESSKREGGGGGRQALLATLLGAEKENSEKASLNSEKANLTHVLHDGMHMHIYIYVYVYIYMPMWEGAFLHALIQFGRLAGSVPQAARFHRRHHATHAQLFIRGGVCMRSP